MFYELKNPVSADFFKKHNHINIHFPAHIHYCFEFLAASEGTLQIIVDGKSQIIHPGEAAVIFPNQLHSLDSLQDGDYLICLFSPDLVQAYFRKYASQVPETNLMKLNPFYMQRFCRIREDLERENDITDENTVFEIKGLLYSICGEFDKQTVYRDAGTACDDLLLREIFQYVEQNYRSDCLLSDLAKTIGYEYTYLSKYFRQTVGTTYTDYVNQHRIRESCYLMQNQHISVEEIARECGFRSVRSFRRNFGLILGMSPSEYRKTYAAK